MSRLILSAVFTIPGTGIITGEARVDGDELTAYARILTPSGTWIHAREREDGHEVVAWYRDTGAGEMASQEPHQGQLDHATRAAMVDASAAIATMLANAIARAAA